MRNFERKVYLMKIKRFLSGALAAAVAVTSLGLSSLTAYGETTPSDVITPDSGAWKNTTSSNSAKLELVSNFAAGDVISALAGKTEIYITFEVTGVDDDTEAFMPMQIKSGAMHWDSDASCPFVETPTDGTYTVKYSGDAIPSAATFNYLGVNFKTKASKGKTDKKVTSIKLKYVTLTAPSISQDPNLDAEPTPGIFRFSYYSMGGDNHGYQLSLASDYVATMQAAGTTQIVCPEEYDDGTNGVQPVNKLSSFTMNDSYVTSVIFGSQINTFNDSFSGFFEKAKALTKVVFKYDGDSFTLNRLSPRDGTSSIKEVYIYASGMSSCHRDAFQGMGEDLKIYVKSAIVKKAILDATEDSTRYKVKSEQVIIMGKDESGPLDWTNLDKVITKADDIVNNHSGEYTETTLNALKTALESVKAVRAKDDGSVTMFDAMVNEEILQNAIEGLVTKTYDELRTQLKSKIDEANPLLKGSYTVPSIEALQAAIDTAQSVYSKSMATKNRPADAEVKSTLDALTKAMTIDETEEAETGLKKIVDTGTWSNFKNANNSFPKENVKDNYTEDSWAKYWAAYQTYLDTISKGQRYFTTKQVTAIRDAVNKAKSELKPIPLDTKAFEEVKKKALDIINAENSPYTKNSLEMLKGFYNQNLVNLEDENGEIKEGVAQHTIDNFVQLLEARIKDLVEKGDVTELKKITEESETLIESDYTSDSWKLLKSKIKAAKALVNDPDNAGKEAVATATEELNAAKEALVINYSDGESDTAKLDNFKKAIEDAKALIDSGYYTDDSVTALQAAVDAAEAVLKDTDKPLPSQMEAPKAALDSAIEAAEYLPADYTAVDEAIAKVPADLSIYTDESVKALNDAIEAVVEGKNITEQETVDGYAKAIEDAIAALVENPKGSIGGTLAIPGADAEVAVTVATADGEVVAEATAANGEYSILDLEDGDYVITFAADGFAARSYAVTVAGGNVSLEAEIHLYGDVNGDGKITTADAGIANAHARQVAILEGYDFDVAEVTGDGKVTTADFGAINAQAQGL